MTRYEALRSVGVLWLVCGCSVTRPVPVAMDAPTLSSYLAEHPAANLRVTDNSGKRYWVHAPKIRGDSLIEHLSRHGDVVIVMGQDQVTGPPGGPARRRYTNVWQLQNGQWRSIARHAQLVSRDAAGRDGG